MLATTALLIPLVSGLFGLPNDTDVLLGGGGKARAILTLDASCSMGGGTMTQICPSAFPAQTKLNKNQMLKAAAVGCMTGDDGIFDRWAEKVDFAVVGFGMPNPPASVDSGVAVIQGFTNDVTTLENAVWGLPVSGWTPLQWGVRESGLLHQATWKLGAGVDTCDQFYNVILSDGNPNQPASPDYDYACDGTTLDPNDSDIAQGTGYLWNNPIVCGVDDNPVSTYSIGFGAAGSFNATILQNAANAGGGKYFYAADAAQLSSVFDQILQSIVTRSALLFGTPSIQSDGLFFGNYIYVPYFKPRGSGPWVGNLKKFCIEPPKDGSQFITSGSKVVDGTTVSFDDCIFTSKNGEDLLTNVAPKDQWTGERALDTTQGGAGQQMYADYFSGLAPLDDITWGSPFSRRRIKTWRPGAAGYVNAEPSVIADSEARTSGCEKTKLFSYLHGYDPDTVDCVKGEPTKLGIWSLGAMINSSAAVIRYAADCEKTAGACLVAVGADDGMVHFFDASTGRETAGLVPGELWSGATGNYRLADILYQPTMEFVRKEYVGGGLVLYHDDQSGDGIINGGEKAMLIWGLGRGGRAYYFMDVSSAPPSGVPGASNEVYTIASTAGTWAENLRDTWATPMIGRGKFTGGLKSYAAFTSGHVWYVDHPAEVVVDSVGLEGGGSPTPKNGTCNSFKTANNIPSGMFEFCEPLLPAGSAQYVLLFGAPGHYDQGTGPDGLRQAYCPLTFPGAAQIGQLKFDRFDIDPSDYVVIEDTNGNPLAPPLSGNLTGYNPATKTNAGPYVVDFWAHAQGGPPETAKFCLRIHSDNNVENPLAGGIRLAAADAFQWAPHSGGAACNECAFCDVDGSGQCEATPKECSPAGPLDCSKCDLDGNGVCLAHECAKGGKPGCKGTHNPFFVAVDLTKINGPNPIPYADKVVDGSQVLLVTRDCKGASNCIDQTTAPVLADMNCPISAPPAVYEEGGIARGFYFGDECGKIWRIWTNDGGTSWDVSVILDLNESWHKHEIRSCYLRRVMRRVDLVVSQCTGGRSIGVYFGTGNIQRASDIDTGAGDDKGCDKAAGELDGASHVTKYHKNYDVVGVVFDDGNIAKPLRLNEDPGGTDTCSGDCLTDATSLVTVDEKASNFRGWFMRLGLNERMLRDPLTVEGVTFFKTYEPQVAPNRCEAGSGVDRVYAVNNCNARPVHDGNGNKKADLSDRTAWKGSQDVGGNLFAYAPKDGDLTVSVLDTSAETAASLVPKPSVRRKGFKLFLYRNPNEL